MSESNIPVTRKQRPLFWILGGCGVLLTCIVIAIAANAVYWTVRLRAGGQPQPPQVAPAAIESTLSSQPEGSPSSGEAVFVEQCAGCHSLKPGERQVGPSLAGVGARAGEMKAGYTAEMYLYESIIDPNAHIVPVFPSGVMPDSYGKQLSEQDLADLVAFLKAQ